MAQTEALIDTLKLSLRSHGLTYRIVAEKLAMSEANVKRMFARRRMTLERLEEICSLIPIELSDLFHLYEETRHQISHLTLEQEEELVRNPRLLLVAVSVRNRLSFEDIVANYKISESECIRCLAALDRLKVIDLLPGNRIKLRIDEDFRWIANGPIEDFFQRQILSQFLRSGFHGEQENRLFVFGLLSDNSTRLLQRRLDSVARELADLHRQDSQLALKERHTIGLLLAMRPWEADVFQPYLRE